MLEFFLITLMTSAGRVLSETNITHEPGQAVANFTISLSQSVNMCSLRVRIRAGNRAGMSALSEAVEVGKKQFSYLLDLNARWLTHVCCTIVCSGGNTDSTAGSTTTGSTASSTRSGSEGDSQQGNSTTLLGRVLIL